MSIFGTSYFKYVLGITERKIQHSIVIASEPETQIVQSESRLDGKRNTYVRGQRWRVEVRVHLFKYVDPAPDYILGQLQADVGREDCFLFEHEDGAMFVDEHGNGAPFTLVDCVKGYLTQTRQNDIAILTFISNDHVDIQRTVNHSNSIISGYLSAYSLEGGYAGFRSSTWTDMNEDESVIFATSRGTGSTLGFATLAVQPDGLSHSIRSTVRLGTDTLSPAWTDGEPWGVAIDQRAGDHALVCFWRQGVYLFKFDRFGSTTFGAVQKPNINFHSEASAQVIKYNKNVNLFAMATRNVGLKILRINYATNPASIDLLYEHTPGGINYTDVSFTKDGSFIACASNLSSNTEIEIYSQRNDRAIGEYQPRATIDVGIVPSYIDFDNFDRLWIASGDVIRLFQFDRIALTLTQLAEYTGTATQYPTADAGNVYYMTSADNNLRQRRFDGSSLPIVITINTARLGASKPFSSARFIFQISKDSGTDQNFSRLFKKNKIASF